MDDTYKYLRLGKKQSDHLVFEISPEGELNIFVGSKYNTRLFPNQIDEDGKKALKDWVNLHIG